LVSHKYLPYLGRLNPVFPKHFEALNMVGVGHYLYLLATLKVSPSALQSPLNLTPNKPVTCKINANTFKKIV